MGPTALFTHLKLFCYSVFSFQFSTVSKRTLIDNDVMPLNFVRSERNLADPLTKPLARRLVSETSKGIGLMLKVRHYG